MSARQALFDGLNASAEGSPLASRSRIGRNFDHGRGAAQSGGTRARLLTPARGRTGRRVGLCMTKSIDAVAAVFGVLKAAAAYVPCDPHAPPSRNAFILADCQVKLAFVEEPASRRPDAGTGETGGVHSVVHHWNSCRWRGLVRRHRSGMPEYASPEDSRCAARTRRLGLHPIYVWVHGLPQGRDVDPPQRGQFRSMVQRNISPYGRGSIQFPCSLSLRSFDSRHLRAHEHGATLVLVVHELGREPTRLADFIDRKRITVWYSAPSILSLMAQLEICPAAATRHCGWSCSPGRYFRSATFASCASSGLSRGSSISTDEPRRTSVRPESPGANPSRTKRTLSHRHNVLAPFLAGSRRGRNGRDRERSR